MAAPAEKKVEPKTRPKLEVLNGGTSEASGFDEQTASFFESSSPEMLVAEASSRFPSLCAKLPYEQLEQVLFEIEKRQREFMDEKVKQDNPEYQDLISKESMVRAEMSKRSPDSQAPRQTGSSPREIRMFKDQVRDMRVKDYRTKYINYELKQLQQIKATADNEIKKIKADIKKLSNRGKLLNFIMPRDIEITRLKENQRNKEEELEALKELIEEKNQSAVA